MLFMQECDTCIVGDPDVCRNHSARNAKFFVKITDSPLIGHFIDRHPF